MGPGTGRGGDRRDQGGQQGEEVKKATLVGDLQEYWGFYAKEVVDTVWDL